MKHGANAISSQDAELRRNPACASSALGGPSRRLGQAVPLLHKTFSDPHKGLGGVLRLVAHDVRQDATFCG